MIYLEFEEAIAYYVLGCLVIFFSAWLFSKYKTKKSKYTREFRLVKCDICMFVYSSMFIEKMTTCPRCGSYNEKEEIT